MRIDLFENFKNQFGVLSRFEMCFQQALRAKDVQTRNFSILDGEAAWIEACAGDFPDWTAGFNVMPGIAKQFETHGIHHIALLVDTTPYSPELLQAPHAIAACVDEDSAQFFELLGHKRALFLPHAIEKEALTVPLKRNRPFDVVFAGSFIDPEAEFEMWKNRFSKLFERALAALVEEALISEKSYMLLYVEMVQNHPEYLQELQKLGLSLFDAMISVDRALRGVERKKVLQSLHGVHLHLFGPEKDIAEWKKVITTQCSYYGPQSFDEMQAIFQQSRVVLNSVPMFKRCVHERALYALAGGASVITNPNSYMQETLVPGKAVRYGFEGLNEAVLKMVENEEERLQEVEGQRRVVAGHHTWDVRVARLLEYIQNC